MTVLEWLKASTRYTFEDATFVKIALDREITVTDDVTTLSVRDKELLTADMIFSAVMFSPSSTSSQSYQHNGFVRNIGSETDIYQSQKINYAKSIYKNYGDPKYDALESLNPKIKTISITDVI